MVQTLEDFDIHEEGTEQDLKGRRLRLFYVARTGIFNGDGEGRRTCSIAGLFAHLQIAACLRVVSISSLPLFCRTLQPRYLWRAFAALRAYNARLLFA